MRKTVLECDRCGRKVDVPHREVPDGWVNLARVPMRPPLDLGNLLNDALKGPKHVCETCDQSYQKWWAEPLHREPTDRTGDDS